MMNYSVDLFGKSLTQIIQNTFSFQTAIDELRGQVRSLQTQISNVVGTVDEIEDRVLVRLQDMRPTLYTRDGQPLDDALETIQGRIQFLSESRTQQEETVHRIEGELKMKVDVEDFERDSRESREGVECAHELAITVQGLQKELQKQRSDQDDMVAKMSQLVATTIERHRSMSFEDDNEDGTEFVSKKDFENELKKLKKAGGLDAGSDDELLDLNDVEGSFARLELKQGQLDRDYEGKKGKLDMSYQKLLAMAKVADREGAGAEEDVNDDDDDDEEYEDVEEIEFESEFDCEDTNGQANEVTYVDVGVQGDDVVSEEPQTRTRQPSDKRRNVGIMFEYEDEEKKSSGETTTRRKKKKKAKGTSRKSKNAGLASRIQDRMRGDDDGRRRSNTVRVAADDSNKTAYITKEVLARVEMMMVDMFSTGGIGGVTLDRADAAALVKQMSIGADIKQDVAKLKTLTRLKIDKTEAERSFELRITRDELYEMLMNLFPNHPTLAKYIPKDKLPLLNQAKPPENTRASHSVTSHSGTRPARKATRTSITAALAPSRDSRFMAFNKRFASGTDGRYYMRDIGTAGTGEGVATGHAVPNLMGSQHVTADITAAQAFDFQPYIPGDSAAKSLSVPVPHEHRAKTPPGGD